MNIKLKLTARTTNSEEFAVFDPLPRTGVPNQVIVDSVETGTVDGARLLEWNQSKENYS